MTDDPIGAALLMAAPLGLAGVFALALLDRIVPVLPSFGLFAAIGIGAAEGFWCVPTAVLASVLGSGTGALGTYRIGSVAAARGNTRMRRLLRRRDRWGRLLRETHRTGTALPFTAQLIPVTRLLAPLLGGAIGRDPRRFLLATCAGLTLWNALLIAFGYAIGRLGGPANITWLSLVCAGLAAGLAVVLQIQRTRSRPARSTSFSLPWQWLKLRNETGQRAGHQGCQLGRYAGSSRRSRK